MSVQPLLTTSAAPAHERVGYWGDLVQRSFGRLRSRTYGDERFHGEIRRYQLGELRLCRLEASRHAVERTSGAAGLSDPGDLKMVVQRRGCSLFEQGGRQAWLAPGSWSVYDTTQSYTVSNPGDVLQYVLLLPRSRILDRAAALVGQRLRDPGLDVQAIAADLQCSKRALHKAFEDHGTSLHRYLWHSRLELARRQLEDPRDSARSITSILLGAGFSSAAHFSRMFRQRYGASPREWRAHHGAAGSRS